MLSARTFIRATSAVRAFATRSEGKVKFFNLKKGYGFITGADNNDYFVHQTNISKEGFRSLATGESVEFDVNQIDGKMQAINVTGPGGKEVIGAPKFTPRMDGDDRPRRSSRRDGSEQNL